MTPKRSSTSVALPDSGTPMERDAAGDAALTIDAVLVAPLLGIAPDVFMAAIKRGVISQVTERGVDDDEGRYRVTFRYRRRRCRVIVNSDMVTGSSA